MITGILCTTGLAFVYYASSRWLADPLEGDRDTTLLETNRVEPGSSAGDPSSQIRYRMQQHQILGQHFDATGGAKVLSSTVSLRYSGTVTFGDGTRQAVAVTKKNGNSVRISISSRFSQTTICVTQRDGWRSVSRMNEIILVEDLSPEEIAGHRRYLSVISELFLASVNGWRMEFKGIEEFNDDLAYRFDVMVTRDHQVSFFIDPESFLNIGRIDRIENGDGSVSETLRLHFDHLQAGGLVIPGRVEVYADAKLNQTLIIEDALRNGGVLDSAFERPVLTQ